LIATGVGGSLPTRLEGGETVVAAVIVAGPKTFPARSPQSDASAPPGPVVAAGWLASTVVGAAAGAATGGIVGALTQAGVSEEDAHSYAEGVRRGGTLVSARVADAERSRLDTILNESAVNLRDRSAAWQKAGWKSFDPASKPYGAEEIQKERQLYGDALR
jgi:hypothetical protein